MKTTTQKELWNITHDWLISLGIKSNKSFTRNEISSHPDYPAMTAVSDFLDAGNMGYSAVQADASYIHEFNYPLLVHIRKPGQEYLHIIPHSTDWDSQKEITKDWSGIVLYPEKKAQWINEENNSYKIRSLKNNLSAALLIFMGLAIFIFASLQQFYAANFVFGLLSFAGLLLSIFISGTELGYQSQLVKQVCGAVNAGGCEQVIKSRFATGVAGVSPGDLSLLYFATQFIFYLVAAIYPRALNIVVAISFVGIPVAAWSVYTQAFKLKQWCALCLGVVAVLILHPVISITWLNTSPASAFSNFNFISLFIFSGIAVVLGLVLFPAKRLLKTNNLYIKQTTELKKWKTDAGLFMSQWQQEQEIDNSIWPNDLLLGNADATIRITVACNTYCGPCAMHINN